MLNFIKYSLEQSKMNMKIRTIPANLVPITNNFKELLCNQ